MACQPGQRRRDGPAQWMSHIRYLGAFGSLTCPIHVSKWREADSSKLCSSLLSLLLLNPKTPSQAATEPNQAHPNNIFTNEGRLATCQSIIHNTQKKIIHLRKEQFNDIYMEFKQLCEISYGVTKGEIPRFVLPLLKNVLAKTGKTPYRLPRSSTRCATPQDNLCLPVRNPYSWTDQDHRNLDKSRDRSPPHLP